MKRSTDLVCFSHLRWNFVFQRPNHLMSQCSRERRVFFVEEPVIKPATGGPAAAVESELVVRDLSPSLRVVTPHINTGENTGDNTEEDVQAVQRKLLAGLYQSYQIVDPIAWFYTPMALEVARTLPASLTIYDCMDELAAFRGAPPNLQALERELFARADLVFTGGQSLFESKRGLHLDVHVFPSSVDFEHFRTARISPAEPADQQSLPHPRIGFFGVLDERLDLQLVERIARERREWSLVMIGPVVKIDPESLPRLPNIHYLGPKRYEQLPAYLAGWQVAIMPFALNESTRFISPTKTLEYLAGGKPVVSTAIRDVVFPYAERGLAQVADHDGFVAAIERALDGSAPFDLQHVDAFLAQTSWQRTWSAMAALIERVLARKAGASLDALGEWSQLAATGSNG